MKRKQSSEADKQIIKAIRDIEKLEKRHNPLIVRYAAQRYVVKKRETLKLERDIQTKVRALEALRKKRK